MAEPTLFDAAVAARVPDLTNTQRDALVIASAGHRFYRVRTGWRRQGGAKLMKLETAAALLRHRIMEQVTENGRLVLRITPAGEALARRWNRKAS